jgi:hypothetical protein
MLDKFRFKNGKIDPRLIHLKEYLVTTVIEIEEEEEEVEGEKTGEFFEL